jgi:hypothetical protein
MGASPQAGALPKRCGDRLARREATWTSVVPHD